MTKPNHWVLPWRKTINGQNAAETLPADELSLSSHYDTICCQLFPVHTHSTPLSAWPRSNPALKCDHEIKLYPPSGQQGLTGGYGVLVAGYGWYSGDSGQLKRFLVPATQYNPFLWLKFLFIFQSAIITTCVLSPQSNCLVN